MNPQVIAFVSGAELRTVDAGGAHESLLHRVPDGRPAAPCWSPDGRTIIWQWSPRGSIWQTPLSRGTSPQLVCSGYCGGPCRNPKWSPLGDEIAIIADRNRIGLPDALLLVPATGGRAHPLYTAPRGYSLLDAAWSSDGSRLAVSEYQPGNGSERIHIIERATGAAATVLDDFGEISFLDWARHKDELAFTGTTLSGVFGVFTCELPDRNSPPGEVSVIFRVNGSRPCYAPDDTELVFQRIPPPHHRKSIHVIDLASGEERLLVRKGMSPNWRRDVIVKGEGQFRMSASAVATPSST